MVVWRIEPDTQNYSCMIPVKQVDWRFFDYQQGANFRKKWLTIPIIVPVKFYDVEKGVDLENTDTKTDKPFGDLSMMFNFLVCNQRALKIVKPLLDSGVTLLSLEYDGQTANWVLLDTLPSIDCFDHQEREQTANGWIRRYILKDGFVLDQHLFTMPSFYGLYTSNTFKSTIEQNSLQGLKFQQVSNIDLPILPPFTY